MVLHNIPSVCCKDFKAVLCLQSWGEVERFILGHCSRCIGSIWDEVAAMTFGSLAVMMPECLTKLIKLHAINLTFRSSSASRLVSSQVPTKFAKHSFSYVASGVQNSPLTDVHFTESFKALRSKLTTFLFCTAFIG